MDKADTNIFAFVLMPFNETFDDVYKLGVKDTAAQLDIKAERVDEQIFQEGILETDWMVYDIWMNVAVLEKDREITISKDKPLATLIPFRRDAYEETWGLEENEITKNVYKRWADYNYSKWGAGKVTDSEAIDVIEEKYSKNKKVYHERKKKYAKPKEEFAGKDFTKNKCPI